MEDSIKELKEALSKFLLDTKDEKENLRLDDIRDQVEMFLERDCLKLDEDTFNEYHGSEDYYDSSC